MRKLKIMKIIFIINILFVIAFAFIRYTNDPFETLIQNKECININKPESMTNEQFLDELINISSERSVDFMIYRVNNNYTYELYKTDIDANFLLLNTENASTITNGNTVFSSHPKNGEKKIYGFISKKDKIMIMPLKYAADLDLSSQRYLVDSKSQDQIVAALFQKGINVKINYGETIYEEYHELYILFGLQLLFLMISVFFYVFSCSRDVIVKKSLGYSNLKLCMEELRKRGGFFCSSLIILLLIFTFLFSIKYDIISSLYFVKKYFLLFASPIAFAMICFMISYTYISLRSNVSHIKGKKSDIILWLITGAFKTIFIYFTVITLSQISLSYYINLNDSAKQSRELVNGYAKTEINVTIEDPEDNSDIYVERFEKLYHIMESDNDMILATLRNIDKKRTSDRNAILSAYVNTNYIDKCEYLISDIGNTITSDDLKKGKANILLPKDTNTEQFNENCKKIFDIDSDEINYLFYDKNSKFFTYDTNTCIDNKGYCQNIALFVFDIEFYKNHCTSDLLFNYLETFFSSGIYFKYDVLSNKSAYEQLLPSIIDCQLNNVMISAPSINELFNEVIKSSAKQLYFKITMLIIFVISFIIMSVYVSELYFYNNSKKLVIKYLNGHSLSYILIYIITLKLICYPIILKISDSTTFGVIYCLLMIIIDILIFWTIIRKNIVVKANSVIKGM